MPQAGNSTVTTTGNTTAAAQCAPGPSPPQERCGDQCSTEPYADGGAAQLPDETSSEVAAEVAAIPAGAGANCYGTFERAVIPERFHAWTVLAKPAVLKGGRYRGTYIPRSLSLPLPLNFASPR